MTRSLRLSLCLGLVSSCYLLAKPANGQSPDLPPLSQDTSEVSQLISHHCSVLRPRRIVIVAPHNRQDRLMEQDLFARALAKHLRSGQQFDVVVSPDPLCRNSLPMHRGTFNENQLIRLSQRYRADTVLYVELNDVVAYKPMQLSVSHVLVHAAESVALVSASSTIRLDNPHTEAEFLNRVQHHCPSAVTATVLHSPTLLIDFAARRTAAAIRSVWP